MKIIVILIILQILLFAGIKASAQTCLWGERVSGQSDDTFDYLTSDKRGDIIIAGRSSSQQTNFNSGIILGGFGGEIDVFIAKYNTNGICQWATKIYGDLWDLPTHISIDENLNAYISGIYYSSSILFNNGRSLDNSSNETCDGFIAKYDSNGRCIWTEKISGDGEDVITSISIDSHDDLFVSGYFHSKILNFNNGKFLINDEKYKQGFIAKYSNRGICQWTQKISGNKSVSCGEIVFDDSNNFYVMGNYESAFIKLNGGKFLGASKYVDVYISKFDSNANCQWIENIGGEGLDEISSIKMDNQNNIIISGIYNSLEINFNNNIKLKNYGNFDEDVFIAKYSNQGLCQWAEKISGESSEYSYSIKLDNFDNMYLTGYFYSPILNFNNGKSLINIGGPNSYFASYNSNGICQWAEKISENSNNFSFDLELDGKNNIFIVGRFDSPKMIFNNDVILLNSGYSGSSDGFLAKFDNLSTSVPQILNNFIEPPLSPNPATDFIEFSVGANGRSPLQNEVRIFNLFGQAVLSVGAIHELPLQVDVSGLAPGMYFVRIGDKVGKFVKL